LLSFRKHRHVADCRFSLFSSPSLSLFLSVSLALSVTPLVSDRETRERRETLGKVSIPRLITLPDPIVQRQRV